MAFPIPGPLVEFILLGPTDDRRQLQDSPILGDVWVEFGRRPADRLDLLIVPYRGQAAGLVAARINETLDDNTEKSRDIAALPALIVARLTFSEMIRAVAPKTKWWLRRWKKPVGIAPAETESRLGWAHEINEYYPESVLLSVLSAAEAWHLKTERLRFQESPPLKRFIALIGLIQWAAVHPGPPTTPTGPDPLLDFIREAQRNVTEISRTVEDLTRLMEKDPTNDPLVWQVSRNRPAMPAIAKSIPAVKADAASHLFKVNCGEIAWAVIDSGIDATHPALLDPEGKRRVRKTYDFKNFRQIVSIGNTREFIRDRNIDTLITDNDILLQPLVIENDPEETSRRRAQAHEDLKRLADDATNQGSIQWELVEKYIQLKPEAPPRTNHGTHVAGIIGASKKAAEASVTRAMAIAPPIPAVGQSPEDAIVDRVVETIVGKENPDFADGMCPDISLYDFRVLGTTIEDTEFAIIAALKFIRYLNSRDNFLAIHGANLSLSIPHDVRNFACGRTPICDECDQLVSSGVVVVAAAGNHGYKSFETNEGSFDGYTAFSITDPGNSESVITVGATHRFWPHTYGVSFFSSRGPTGDGRLKPDLVAPGERINAPLPRGEWGDLDGTSMAAPHVSGAAAMLMARYSELVGQPRRIKRILLESATDLERERSFQGHGMLDVLRALQSI